VSALACSAENPIVLNNSPAKILWVFYKQGKSMNEFLSTNSCLSRNNYFRILALGCVDILLTLPIGILSLVIMIQAMLQSPGVFSFYYSGEFTDPNWAPFIVSWAELQGAGFWNVFSYYFQRWVSVVLGFAIFALFGMTPAARQSYGDAFNALGSIFGLKSLAATPRATHHNSDLVTTIAFVVSPVYTSNFRIAENDEERCAGRSPLCRK
jgi:hypothetical protein